jgi:hypothetical protein
LKIDPPRWSSHSKRHPERSRTGQPKDLGPKTYPLCPPPKPLKDPSTRAIKSAYTPSQSMKKSKKIEKNKKKPLKTIKKYEKNVH